MVGETHLLSVSAGVQAGHQVEHVPQWNGIQVLDEGGEQVVDVSATVLQLGGSIGNNGADQ